jgi:outer membrane protein OmpA-like peptidoglycan-associated protein
VFFDFNKDFPNATSMLFFQNWIKMHEQAEIVALSGFCDSVDGNSYNKELASRRIGSVLKILKKNNFIVSDSLETNAVGEDFDQSKVQSENRKVTIFFEENKKEPQDEKLYIDELSAQVKDAKTGDVIRLKNINFYNYSPKILPKSLPVLYDLLCILEDNPKLKIEIQGHICCQLQSGVYDVSAARAKAVYIFLLQNRINRKRLSFKGYGNTRPIYPIPERNEEERDMNRRVEIKIIEK